MSLKTGTDKEIMSKSITSMVSTRKKKHKAVIAARDKAKRMRMKLKR